MHLMTSEFEHTIKSTETDLVRLYTCAYLYNKTPTNTRACFTWLKQHTTTIVQTWIIPYQAQLSHLFLIQWGSYYRAPDIWIHLNIGFNCQIFGFLFPLVDHLNIGFVFKPWLEHRTLPNQTHSVNIVMIFTNNNPH